MQVSNYISEPDYETLAKNKPKDSKTVSQFMSQILREKAEFFRTTTTASGEPVIPQYERQ